MSSFKIGRQRQTGFTLLEIMIALAIFAVVSGALIRNAAQAIRQTSVIQQKTLAYWIAENQLNQMRASPRLEGSFPSIGSERYSVTMADRDWEVIMDVEATENSDMRRIKVSVFAEDDPDEYIAELVGFRGKY